MMKEGYYSLEKTHGFLLKKLPQDIHAEVKSMVDNIQEDFTQAIPANDKLAGHIDKEYLATLTNKATQYIRYTVEEYIKYNPDYINQLINNKNPGLSYDGECWVNFQEKYEYNPMHRHTGAFSYVIWYKIPYLEEDEVRYGAGYYREKTSERNYNGQFVFICNNMEGDIRDFPLPIDKTMEGYVAVFPSSLNHIVYPFYTSDNYRITISGNIYLQDQ